MCRKNKNGKRKKYTVCVRGYCRMVRTYGQTAKRRFEKNGKQRCDVLRGEKIMSKYRLLWEFIKNNGSPRMKLTFDEIHEIAGIEIDHSFLSCKKELTQYGYSVGKISLKEKTVIFNKSN